MAQSGLLDENEGRSVTSPGTSTQTHLQRLVAHLAASSCEENGPARCIHLPLVVGAEDA